jgi:hypothetical protein
MKSAVPTLSKFDHVGIRVEVRDRVGPEIAHEYKRIFTVAARQSIARAAN